MTEPGSYAALLEVLERIEVLLAEISERVIDGDPQMLEAVEKARNGDR